MWPEVYVMVTPSPARCGERGEAAGNQELSEQ